MDNDKAKKGRKVRELKEIIIVTNFLCSDYIIKPHDHNKIGKTGLLTVAELHSDNLSLPKYVFRWDEPGEELDVDIYKKGKNTKSLWSKGYSGHHTKRITSAAGRVFEAKINSPSGKVFEGYVKVPVIWVECGNIKSVCKIKGIEK